MASNITVQYFLNLFGEFKKVEKATIEAYLGIASGRLPEFVWGSNTGYATALMTAHMLTCQGKNGQGVGGGAVSDQSVGELSRSFATVFDPSRGDAPLMTTRYGIDFIALRKETIVTGMTTRGFARRPFN